MGPIVRVLAGAALTLAAAEPAGAREELNVLAWCDHSDAALFAPFEAANDVKVNVKVYELTGAALSILEQSRPGDWDLIVVDTADVVRMAKAGWFEELNPADFPYADFFEGATAPHLHEVDGKLHSVPEKFGFNTLSYDKAAFPEGHAPTLADMWKPGMKGRLAVYDYYLPVIMTVGLAKGIKPAEFGLDDLEALKPDLFALKSQAKVVGDIVASETALSQGDVSMLLGVAEWVAAVAKERPNLSWNIPAEGGLRWSQSVSIFKDSEKKDLALQLAQYLVSPEGQGLLARASCYWAMPVNKKAILSDADKAALNFDRIEGFLANSYAYGAADEELDRAMVEAWTEFLAH